jgi:hypothetical protein
MIITSLSFLVSIINHHGVYKDYRFNKFYVDPVFQVNLEHLITQLLMSFFIGAFQCFESYLLFKL